MRIHLKHLLGCMQDSVIMVRDLFRNEGTTEFVIATIPTMLGINESSRLLQSLRKENIPCSRIIVNQVSCALSGCLRVGPAYLKAHLSMAREGCFNVCHHPQACWCGRPLLDHWQQALLEHELL